MPNYEETLQFLDQRLPMFSRIGNEALKKGLRNITLLCEALGNPQNNFPSIHIAGTNGKGSTSHLLAAALQQNGYKTGLYTSPHLKDIRERFRINGKMVSKDFIINFVQKVTPLIATINPSYFELNVAMAFTAFSEEKVDVAVIETGMGGRLDSTNIILPVLSIITNIGLDHIQFLGTTLAEIAFEKAGIIKEKVPVLIGSIQPETEKVFLQTAFAKSAPIYFAENMWELVPAGADAQFQYFKAVDQKAKEIIPLKTDLLGSFQLHNLKTALSAAMLLRQSGWNLPQDKVLKSFEAVKSNTGLRGRWDWIQQKPNVILDVAHNAAGMAYLMDNLRSLNSDDMARLHIVLGFVKDKDATKILELLPHQAAFYFTQAKIPRALEAAALKTIAAGHHLKGAAYPAVEDAVKAAMAAADEHDTILITGSFFIVGEAMEYLDA